MNLMQYLDDKFFIYANIFNLSRKAYSLIKQKCQERLKKYPNNYAALYIFALFGYYIKDLKMAYEYYIQLIKNHKVKKNIHEWFIKNIIAYQLFRKDLNELTKEKCFELIQLIDNQRIKIKLLKYLCIALDRLREYDKVLETCLELKSKGFYDHSVEKYEKKAEMILKKIE